MGNDISIALTFFSVFAPAGAIAFLFIALLIIFTRECSPQIKHLEHWLILPLAVCMTGLVFSATHLGTPSNALYVLIGWGRSPLSNEVVSALVFLLVAGIFWLSSFSEKVPFWVTKILLAASSAAALWLVSMISVVYSIPTIQTWNSQFVPFILWSMALATGPLLTITTIVFAKRTRTAAHDQGEVGQKNEEVTKKQSHMSSSLSPSKRELVFLRIMPVISFVALISGLGLMTAQSVELMGIENAFGFASDLVPWYGAAIVGYVVLGTIGIVIQAVPLFQRKLPLRWSASCSIVLIFIGALVIRVAFYSMRMTIGF